jgi:hypothetical protein
MPQLTITEALQEIKTIGKRLEKKRASVMGYLARDFRVHDPLEKDGGSEKFIREERQAIADLERRVITIRTSIQRSNLAATLKVGDNSMTVAEWLTWRREIAKAQGEFLRLIVQGLNGVRNDVQKKGGKVVSAVAAVNEAFDPSGPPQIVVNVDERTLISEQEAMEQVTGDLDGKLSLFNATTVIEV